MARPYDYYRRQALAAEEVRQLSRLRPRRAVMDALVCWLCIGAAWLVVAQYPSIWTVIPAALIIGSRYYALLIIGHDGFHGRVFPNRRWNDLFCDFLIFAPIGAVTRLNKCNHLAHHKHLATPADPDRRKHATVYHETAARLLAYLIGLRGLVQSVEQVFVRPLSQAHGGGRYRPFELFLITAWQVALIAGLTYAVGWWGFPALWLAPVYFVAYLGDNLRAFAEHSHPREDEWANHHRLITFRSNPVERFFLAPMNMNYHAVHHLWTSIPYYNLPQADQALRASPYAQGLLWRRSYLAYLWSYLRACPIRVARPMTEKRSAA